MPSNLYCELWAVQELKDNGLDYASSKTQILNMRQKSLNQKTWKKWNQIENELKCYNIMEWKLCGTTET